MEKAGTHCQPGFHEDASPTCTPYPPQEKEGSGGLQFISFHLFKDVTLWLLGLFLISSLSWIERPGTQISGPSPYTPPPAPASHRRFLAGHGKSKQLPSSLQSIFLLPLIFIGLCLKCFVCNYTVCCMSCFIMTNMKFIYRQREAHN